jgi:hypothetical protein
LNKQLLKITIKKFIQETWHLVTPQRAFNHVGTGVNTIGATKLACPVPECAIVAAASNNAPGCAKVAKYKTISMAFFI